MFLLRVVFWLAVVAVVWPQIQPNAKSDAQLSAGFEPSEADTMVVGAVRKLSTFCDDYDVVCKVGDAAVGLALVEATYATGLLHEWLENRLAERDHASGEPAPDEERRQ